MVSPEYTKTKVCQIIPPYLELGFTRFHWNKTLTSDQIRRRMRQLSVERHSHAPHKGTTFGSRICRSHLTQQQQLTVRLQTMHGYDWPRTISSGLETNNNVKCCIYVGHIPYIYIITRKLIKHLFVFDTLRWSSLVTRRNLSEVNHTSGRK